MTEPIEIVEIEARGLRFRARRAGRDGEPVLLLHGFPETSHMWTGLMPALAEAGYQCLAPDQRGYSPGARPDDVEAYRYDELAADVAAIAAAAGFDRYHLVGHDWGALSGWAVLARDPPPVVSWSALSVPHYQAFARAVVDDPEEQPYREILDLLLTPGAAEDLFSAADFAAVRDAWANSSADEVDDYLSVFRPPGALTAAMNWYRASRGHRRAIEDESFVFGPVTTPTLMLRGLNDPYIRQMAYDLAAPLMVGPYRVVDLDAGHWLAQEKPDQVGHEILAHLAAHPR